MKLYNKIQELITESETLKQKNDEVLALARNELSELVKEKANENLESLKNTIKGYLNDELVGMPLIVKKNVTELINKQSLTEEIRNELLSQFDKQAIINDVKQELKNEIKTTLEEILQDRELQNTLQQAKNEIITETTSETTNALTSKILGILETQLNAITQSVIKNLDFSFLSAQPKAFYSVINENLKGMFLKELESEILKNFIKETIDNALSEDERLKALKLAELKALTYLQVTEEANKTKLMQDALLLETQILNNKLKIENEIAYNLKRKELIQEGKLDDEAFKKNIFKVI
ncbi:hypothetical protein HPHPA4_1596 [Helicobacter pylori Hp A-4]|uniref:hypothetical protein n=1 Tax=Helicobacter pylori TaxID=210 RepID=UPI00026A5C1C|nr:hypothetical protein [Helicobacter pylori]EJB40668.1 hypothetical protein HPHPA4_1596 [Helicobacter pylori Hp A-4]